jgi:cyclopropane-fatty-acyl-phospholipid synthase
MRLLDVGCGWGGMVLHAVRNYGVTAIGVTLSQQQALWGQQAIEEAGLEQVAQVRFSDYRDVPETEFDAVSSIGLTEHIGRANYPAYFGFLYGRLKPRVACSTTPSPGPTTSSQPTTASPSSIDTCSRTGSSPVRRRS